MSVWAIIPARSGSKTVPDKNIRALAGKPLIAWSIGHALAAETVDRTIVSTDSEQYARIARDWGAETPFLRPAAISGDASLDIEVFQHVLSWADRTGETLPDVFVHLRPTCPVRDPATIDRMVECLLAAPDLDSVRTVTPVIHPPYKMWTRRDDGTLAPVAHVDGIEEPWNAPRQALPPAFIQTAGIDVVRATVVRSGSMTGRNIHGWIETDFHDIDTAAELEAAAARLGGVATTQEGSDRDCLTVCFDIDGVIAGLTPGNDYAASRPVAHIVDAVNRLHDAGHRIILFTARGSVTGIDWEETTRKQLSRWGVRYDELRFGKPAADVYIDDRMVSLEHLNDFVASACNGGHT